MIRPDSQEWLLAKARGDSAELAIANWFQERGFETYKTLGNAPFDLLLQCQVEVKRDLKATKTGNVAVEMRYRGNPSGVLISQATFWVIVLDTEAVILKTEILRKRVLQGNYREVAAGENLASTVALVPVEQLKQFEDVRVVTLQSLDK